jgi:hypothetical protein
MKKLILAMFLCFGFHAFAQSGPSLKETFLKIKSQSKTDPNDKAVYNLLDEFYQKSLQAENDEMTPETVQQIEKLASIPIPKIFIFLCFSDVPAIPQPDSCLEKNTGSEISNRNHESAGE